MLDALNAVTGSLLMINVDGRELLIVPNATSVGLYVTSPATPTTISTNCWSIDLGARQGRRQHHHLRQPRAMQSVDLGSLTTADGSLTVSDNPALNAILISGVTSIGGDLTVVGTADDGRRRLLTTTVTGSLDISDNTSATAIDMGSLTTVSGALIVSGNTSVAGLDLSSLTSAGSVDISGNTSVSTIDVSGLTTVSGDLTVVDNGDAAVDMSAGTDVGGSLTIETTGTGAFPWAAAPSPAISRSTRPATPT